MLGCMLKLRQTTRKVCGIVNIYKLQIKKTNRNYLPVKTLPDLPYSEDYLELLDDINENKITYDNIGSQLTSTEEHYVSEIPLS